MTTTTVLLVCLACYRGTLLVTSDRVTRTQRRWLRARLQRRSHQIVIVAHPRTGMATAVGCNCSWSARIAAPGDDGPYLVSTETKGVQPQLVDRPPTAHAAVVSVLALGDAHAAKAPDTSRLGYLLECPWCVSIYLGTAGAAVAYVWPTGWWRWPALALAASAVAGLLATIASPDDNDPED